MEAASDTEAWESSDESEAASSQTRIDSPVPTAVELALLAQQATTEGRYDIDMERIRGDNTTSGLIGFGSDAIAVTMLADTGSDVTFISERIVKQLKDPDIRKAPEITIRLTNGVLTRSNRILRVGLQLGDFRAFSQLRVLEWNAYDVILGMNWLKTHHGSWDLSGSKLTLANGTGHRACIHMRPNRTLEAQDEALADLHLLSYHAAQKALHKTPDQVQLYIIRDKKETKSQSGLPKIIDTRYEPVVKRYRELFREELPEKLAKERDIKHEIDTGDARPVNLPSYHLSQDHRIEQEAQIQSLLEKGLIRPSSSAWGFPVLFVPKPGGKWRMCIDYRMLNNLTRKDAYPLPRIQDCLDDIGKSKRLSKIDLTSGYWQIHVQELSIPKTAFNTRSGKYEFIAMPFGLCNAPATFQRIMNDALRDFLGKFVIVYLDDIVIYSDSDREHEKHLQQVFEALKKHELFAKPSKCVIGASEIEFCAHIIGQGKVRPIPSKVRAILDWPRLRNVHEVRQFLGLAGYYRRYIAGFARIAAPLSDLLIEADSELRKKKFRPIRWTPIAQHAFEKLKEALTAEPVLIQPDRTKPYRIETDASEWAVGAVLMQEDSDSKWHPVAYDGRKLNKAELNYPVHEKELLAIKEALRTWNEYISNSTTTTIITDHESLQYLSTTKTPSKRLARWVEEFAEYSLDIKYRKGSEAIVPDAISRRPDLQGKGPANRAWVEGDLSLNQLEAMTSLNPMDIEFDWESTLIQFLQDGIKSNDPEIRAVTCDLSDIDRWEAENNRLYRKVDHFRVPWVPEPLRHDFIRHYHENYGHWSAPALLGVTRARGWWFTMEKDIVAFAHACATCQLSQRPKPGFERESPRHQVDLDARPFSKWAIDFVGVLPTSLHGNKWLLTAIDIATGWPLAKAMPEATDEAVADFLYEEIYCQYGAPQEILSDNGTNLTSKMIDFFLTRIKTRHRVTTAYHPRTNGKVERMNGMLGTQLTKKLLYDPVARWDECVHEALFDIRVRCHSATKTSPFTLVYGMEPRVEGTQTEFEDLHMLDDFESRLKRQQTARHEANAYLLKKALRTKKLRSDKVTEHRLTERDLCLIRNENRTKFEPTYFGPFRVLRVRPFGTYALETMDGRVLRNLVNGSRLRTFATTVTRNGTEYPTDAQVTVLTQSLKNALNRQAETLGTVTPELLGVLQQDGPVPPTYNELSLMTRDEWQAADWDNLKRPRFNLVGEDQGVQATIASRKRRAKAKGKKTNVQKITNRTGIDIETPELDVVPHTAAIVPEASSEQALGRVLTEVVPERRTISTPATTQDRDETESTITLAQPKRVGRPKKTDSSQGSRIEVATESLAAPIRQRVQGARELRANPKPKQWSTADLHI